MERLTCFAKWLDGVVFAMSFTHRLKWIIGFVSIFIITQTLNAASLAWEPNQEADLAGYKIYYGTSSRIYTQQWNVGNVTTWTIPENQPNGYFAATAYNVDTLESDYSNEVLFTRDAQQLPPSPATGLVVQWVEVKKTNVFYIAGGLQAQDAGKPIGTNTFYITGGLPGYDQGGP